MGRRLLAALVDGALALVLVVLPVALAVLPGRGEPDASLAAGPLAAGSVLLLGLTVTQWVLLGRRGWTVGKRLLGVLVLSERSGFPPGLGPAFLRLLVPAAANLLPLLGPVLVHLSPFFDPSGRRQGWHDKVAGTVVVDARRAPAPGAGQVERRLQHLLTPVGTPVPASATDRPWSPTTAPASPPAPLPDELEDTGVVQQVPGVSARPTAPWAPSSAEPAAVPARPSALHAPALSRGLVAGTRVVPAPEVVTSVPFPHQPSREEEDVESTRLRPARAKVPELAASDHEATVELTDGQRVTFSGVALVGRNPTPRAGEDGCRLIRVADPGRSVSKTHLLLGVDRNGLWVKDRHSTNGTVVTLADGQQILCGADQQVRLPAGASVAFGDYGLSVATVDAV